MTDLVWMDRVAEAIDDLHHDEALEYVFVMAEKAPPGGPRQTAMHLHGPEGLSRRNVIRKIITALETELLMPDEEEELPELIWSQYEDTGDALEYYAYLGAYRLSVRKQGGAWVWTLKNRDTSEEISGFKGTADDAKAEALLRAYEG
jgi:hypothetical protein